MQKLTPNYIMSLVENTDYRYDGTYTICIVTTTCGHKVIGTSRCLMPEDYDLEQGQSIAFRNAFDQLWELEGYYQRKLEEHRKTH